MVKEEMIKCLYGAFIPYNNVAKHCICLNEHMILNGCGFVELKKLQAVILGSEDAKAHATELGFIFAGSKFSLLSDDFEEPKSLLENMHIFLKNYSVKKLNIPEYNKDAGYLSSVSIVQIDKDIKYNGCGNTEISVISESGFISKTFRSLQLGSINNGSDIVNFIETCKAAENKSLNVIILKSNSLKSEDVTIIKSIIMPQNDKQNLSPQEISKKIYKDLIRKYNGKEAFAYVVILKEVKNENTK